MSSLLANYREDTAVSPSFWKKHYAGSALHYRGWESFCMHRTAAATHISHSTEGSVIFMK